MLEKEQLLRDFQEKLHDMDIMMMLFVKMLSRL